MIDIKFLRENPEAVKENIRKKFQDNKLPLVDEVIELDAQARKTQQEADNLRANRNKLSKQIGALMGKGKKEEAEEVKKQVAFVKQYRKLIHTGTCYRLADPFATNEGAWMVVSKDKKEAIVMYSRILIHPNSPTKRLKLKGLDPDLKYSIQASGKAENRRFGDELMYAGLITTELAVGDIGEADADVYTDFYSKVYVLKAQ